MRDQQPTPKLKSAIAAMYIHLNLFLKAEYLSLFRTRFRFRRWLYIFFFTALYWLMWFIVAFGRMLDHIFFPGFKQPAGAAAGVHRRAAPQRHHADAKADEPGRGAVCA